VRVPDPGLVERPARRRFTAEYKLRIIHEAEACTRPGGIGAVLRREGLYTSHLSAWRRQRDQGALQALDRPRGRRRPHPLERENAELRQRMERAEAELAKARRVIEVQGNVSALLGELLAELPNELWSWDITKLLGPEKWSYFYLYVVLDVFSRYVVGWTVQHRESAAVAEQMIAQAAEQQGIERDRLTIHADRGGAMRSKPVAFLLADLGITRTHSRPYTSTDNPFSEAHFKTLKCRPGFPDRFGSILEARSFCCDFFAWYNHEHRHSGIALMPPAAVRSGRAEALHAERARVLAAAHAAHPERFVRGLPRLPALPAAAWINPPKAAEAAQ
jgi:transposase InsO family protein